METASEKVTDELQEVVPERHCLETEKRIGSDLDTGKSKYRRIVYTREFLLECFRHPACSRKPQTPLPNLDVTLNAARLGPSPYTPHATPRRKEDNGRKEPEDNISLRPHSGNFSSGCAPNLSPAHFPQNSYNRYPFPNEDPSKNMFDRTFPRNNYRFNVRPDQNERNRVEREREPRERDRERENRENRARNPNQGRRQPSLLWGPEGENHPEWNNRRRPNNSDKDYRGRTSFNKHHHYDEPDEPEWFSGGPTSQNETIELHGFQDDERREQELKSMKEERATHRSNETRNNVGHKMESKSEEANGMDMSGMDLEKILISDILPNGLMMESGAEPEGISRFSKLFQRNSSPPITKEEIYFRNGGKPEKSVSDGMNLQALFAPKPDTASSTFESKSDVIKGMETELRQILLRSKEKEVPEQPKEQPKQEDLNAFKKLLEDLVIKSNKTAPQTVDGSGRPVPTPPPGLQGMQFNPFAFGVAQPRPLQPHNAIVPNVPMNQVLPVHPVNRMVDHQQQETSAQSQKRSATPVLSSAFTPTAVMRRATADQQSKPGASFVNTKPTNFGGLPQPMANPANSAFPGNAIPAHHPNPLSSFMSAVAQNQAAHLPVHPSQAQQVLPPPSHPGLTRPGHNMPHPAGFRHQRIHFPVVVGPPNTGMPGQFPPFMIYPQMPQRK